MMNGSDIADITCLRRTIFLRTMGGFDHPPLSYSHNLKSLFLRSQKSIFTRSTMHDSPTIYTLETRAVAMIWFGYKHVRKKCIMH